MQKQKFDGIDTENKWWIIDEEIYEENNQEIEFNQQIEDNNSDDEIEIEIRRRKKEWESWCLRWDEERIKMKNYILRIKNRDNPPQNM